ncbi:hypothetical protein [Pseudoalteromonas porphyrae]|uniref:hypothetical protein n=1 Tax=Pseudoalteromonas porphyrae TaxID=187330 RepID=UPI000A41E60A|nr:hypothetical protein [Pseudoalteromonas porphyrae]
MLFPFLSTNDEDLKQKVSLLIVKIAHWKKLPPRSAMQLADRLLTSIELIENEKTVDIVVLSVLICLYMFNKSEFDYFHSTLVAEYFYFDSKATTLILSDEKLNLQKTLEEMTLTGDGNSDIKQVLKIPDHEKQKLLRYSRGFPNIDILAYIECFNEVLRREGNIRNPGFVHTFDYDSRGDISDSQLLQAYMTLFGINLATFDYYLSLISLTNKFSDS